MLLFGSMSPARLLLAVNGKVSGAENFDEAFSAFHDFESDDAASQAGLKRGGARALGERRKTGQAAPEETAPSRVASCRIASGQGNSSPEVFGAAEHISSRAGRQNHARADTATLAASDP